MSLNGENLTEFADLRSKADRPLQDEECAQIMRGLLKGIYYLHDH
jgi:serine/threonine protein kinase